MATHVPLSWKILLCALFAPASLWAQSPIVSTDVIGPSAKEGGLIESEGVLPLSTLLTRGNNRPDQRDE